MLYSNLCFIFQLRLIVVYRKVPLSWPIAEKAGLLQSLRPSIEEMIANCEHHLNDKIWLSKIVILMVELWHKT